MSSLTSFLRDRLHQLKHRKMMIPRYVERPEKFLGKNDFSLEDLPKIEADITETEAALAGIVSWKKVNYRWEAELLLALEKIEYQINQGISAEGYSVMNTRGLRVDKQAVERVKKLLETRKAEKVKQKD